MTRRRLAALLVALLLLAGRGARAQDLIDLPDAPVTGAQEKLLERLVAAPPPECFDVMKRLAAKPSADLVRRLVALAGGESEESRRRAGLVLGSIPAKASLKGALELALDDASTAVREAVATSLTQAGVPALIAKADLVESARKGLADRHAGTRFAFALALAHAKDPAAAKVLKGALRDRDHHRREAAAEALAVLGDPAGVGILIRMIRYTDRNHPLLKSNAELRGDAETWKRLLSAVDDERVRVCGHLERLAAKKALSALETLRRTAREPRVTRAAAKAIEAITGG